LLKDELEAHAGLRTNVGAYRLKGYSAKEKDNDSAHYKKSAWGYLFWHTIVLSQGNGGVNCTGLNFHL
jgi:hypothetical protein